MQTIEDKLEELGIILPPAPKAVANYLGTKQFGNQVFVSGRKSDLTGAVGRDVSEQEAKAAASQTILLLLAILRLDLGTLNTVETIINVRGFIRSAEGFDRQPQVLDGASDVLISIWGENGRHARTATATHQLPYGATIQLDMIVGVSTRSNVA